MKFLILIVAVALGLAYSVIAYAGGTRPDAAVDAPWRDDLPVGIATGKYLIANCQGTKGTDLQWCIGYIEAIRDEMYVEGKNLCGSENNSITNWEHLRTFVLSYLYRHPKQLEKYAGKLIRAALNEAFPCE